MDVSSYDDLHGGTSVYWQSFGDFKRQIKSLELEEVVPTEMYFEVFRVSNHSTQKIKYLFAYAYETGNVYFKKQDKCYLIKNPEPLREFIAQKMCDEGYFYSDWKIFWYSKDADRVYLNDNSFYTDGLEFRYDRYFALEPKDISDYVYTYGNYTGEGVTDVAEMVRRLAEGMGQKNFEAYLAYDKLTNYIRVEFYGENKKALIYLDDSYNVIWGTLKDYSP